MAATAAAKAIGVTREMPDASCFVRADTDRLRQVIWNLLSNAMKFTPRGGHVALRLFETDGAYALDVTDTGIGIHPAFLDHVFERFRQADGSSTREHDGLGLGLAIAKELVELHGGTVSVSSAGPGRGSTFTVTLPKAAGGATPTAEIVDVDAGLVLKGVDVLAVDDNRDTLDVLGSTLRNAGATVRLASSGPEAVELFRQAGADVLLCDLAMPQMDGFAVLSQIRRIENGAGHTTPAFALTAYASDQARLKCLRAGFDGHFAKPYDARALIRAVAEVLGRRS